MKTVFDAARLAVCQPKPWFVCLVFAACVIAGCGKSRATAPVAAPPVTTDATSASQTPSMPTAVDPQAAATTNPQVPKAQMQAMNRALLIWMRTNKRRPKTFEEFATSTDFQIPAPPAGEKYTFDGRGFIILVGNTSH